MRRKPIVSREVIEAAAKEQINIDALLRDLLKLPPVAKTWDVKGVSFPEGTLFRCWWKDRPYWGEVKNGALVIGDKSFNSPSEATTIFSNPPVNGWRVWECRFPNTRQWVEIADLRGTAVMAD